MSQHILDWLPAYHDGELSPERQRQVEKHLQACPDCLAELEALDGLSALLKVERMPERISPERFAAQVQLRLPRSLPPQASPYSSHLRRDNAPVLCRSDSDRRRP